jgi:uncharacterized protein YfaS (alpha-2-macroglobulin family)
MRKLSLLAILLMTASAIGQQPDYERLKTEAERFYAEKSYAKSYELYKQAEALKLSPSDARWVGFRVGDALWRSEAATQTADQTKLDQAREKLESFVRDVKRAEDQDRLWAEVQESLGDFWWSRINVANWNEAWPHYQNAFDWWAAQSDLDVARPRYLQLVWKAAAPPWANRNYYAYNINQLPVEILQNAIKIAQDQNDQARAHFYLATRFRMSGDWRQRAQVPGELEAALKPGKTSDWYDDALYFYGEWMENTGRITEDDSGNWQQQPDHLKALELFRRLLSEFRKGESRYYDQAQQQIDNITKPMVGVAASNVFLPDSEIQVSLSYRNVKRIELSLYKVDLPRDVQFDNKNQSSWGWVNQVNLVGRDRVKQWSKETKDDGAHKPGQEWFRLDERLTPGAYVAEASSGATKARDIILVSESSLVLKTLDRKALVYFCNAIDGAPVANAAVTLWEKDYRNLGGTSEWIWNQTSAKTDGEGIANINLNLSDTPYREIFVSAASGDKQAFAVGQSYGGRSNDQPWRIYAFTDRPAYRPNETVQWKFVARKLQDSVYSTPANQVVKYEIRDPRGNKIKEDKVMLSTFGSAWGTLALTDAMPLGAYQIIFLDESDRGIGSANLFRLEEYKLPEFKVAIRTPEVDGHKKAFRLGEKVDVTINADYYFGGSVNDAKVEVVVYQNPFYHYYQPPHEFDWFYADFTPRYYYGGYRGQIVKRETLKTDASGKATLSFDTPKDSSQDFQFFIEARVTDSSRREIVGSDTVRVTRQRYYVYPRAVHNLYRPNDKVQIDLKSIDANDQPLAVTGQVKITRDWYYEIWTDPTGRDVAGDELKKVRDTFALRHEVFPPAPEKDGRHWQLIFRGYQHDEVSTQQLKTNAAGEAELNFTPAREGYYRVAWISPDKDGPVVKAETAVWVTTDRTSELGYRHGGVEIIVDQDTFRAGQTASVMLNTQASDRYVLFSVEGDDLYSYRLIHLDGTSKLIELPVSEKYVPNVFLNAAMVSDRQFFTDSKQVIVPPVDHFLNVELKSDQAQYQPQEEGTLTVTTRDRDGKPVAAEVALGLIDASVFYIQKDQAGDPRQFYFGTKRQLHSQVVSTFQQKSYAKLIEGPDKQLIDELTLAQRRLDVVSEKDSYNRLQSLAELRPSGTLQTAPAAIGLATESVDVFSNGPINGRVTGAFAGGATNLSFSGGASGTWIGARNGRGDFPEQEPAVQVRNDFRSTVFWQPDVTTDANGTATVKVKYPDSLTSWTATARVITAADKFGIASADTRTKKPLIVRLEAPRFFVVGDTATVSAVINNNNDQPMSVTPSLDAQGITVASLRHHASASSEAREALTVPANGEQRVDWTVNVSRAGPVKLKVTARGEAQADAMEREFTAYEHGIEKLLVKSGKLRTDEAAIKLDIPKERRTESTNVTVQVAPSMAVTMLDALPYLIDYPYGCTEQTMSRFLPAAITAKTLQDVGLSAEAAMSRVFGGIEPDTAPQTHPKGKRDLRELARIEKESLDRLYGMQHADGGWGWWKDDASDRFMTAYVLWGLVLAKDSGLEIKQDAVARAANWLDAELIQEEDRYDMQAWLLHALAAYSASRAAGRATEFQARAFQNLWTNREKLNAYTRALLALSAHSFGYNDQAQTLIRNLENGVKLDRTPDVSVVQRGAQMSDQSVIGTAHWGEDGIFYRWSDGGIEATAFVLRALLKIDPQNKLIEPVTNWLIKNRRGAQWNNTRDTAISILALNDYLRVTREAASAVDYEILVNGNSIATKHITPSDALSAPSQFTIDRKLIHDGVNDIRIRRTAGSSPLYFSAQARFFSLEEPIRAAGNEIFVRREYFKLVGRPTLLKGYVYDRVPLRDGETIVSGDRVEVVITAEAKNNYEYLLFEDLKPAGLEAVELRSGEPLYAQELRADAVERTFNVNSQQDSNKKASNADVVASRYARHSDPNYTGRTAYVYQELRDRKVALFIGQLPQGIWQIRYSLRAEAPGNFHALPVLGQAMYVPEIRCNDDEMFVKVVDKGAR